MNGIGSAIASVIEIGTGLALGSIALFVLVFIIIIPAVAIFVYFGWQAVKAFLDFDWFKL